MAAGLAHGMRRARRDACRAVSVLRTSAAVAAPARRGARRSNVRRVRRRPARRRSEPLARRRHRTPGGRRRGCPHRPGHPVRGEGRRRGMVRDCGFPGRAGATSCPEPDNRADPPAARHGHRAGRTTAGRAGATDRTARCPRPAEGAGSRLGADEARQEGAAHHGDGVCHQPARLARGPEDHAGRVASRAASAAGAASVTPPAVSSAAGRPEAAPRGTADGETPGAQAGPHR